MNDAISFLHVIINYGVKSEKKFGKLLVILQNYLTVNYRKLPVTLPALPILPYGHGDLKLAIFCN